MFQAKTSFITKQVFEKDRHMNKIFNLAFLSVAVLTALIGSQAMASNYSIYVTSSTHISPAQAELSTLVQKDIQIDTDAKTVSFSLATPCTSDRCSQITRNITLALTQIQSENAEVSSVRAEGTLYLNSKPTQAIVQITLNPDHSMDITITNSSDCKSTHSSFVGSPASDVISK